jgi:hypothetical protein
LRGDPVEEFDVELLDGICEAVERLGRGGQVLH